MLSFFASLSTAIQAVIKEQAPEVTNKSLENPATDGAVCDESHHQVVFDDATLKVIDVIVDPNEVEIFHTHERCAVMYVDIPANIILEIKDQESITITNPLQRFAIIPQEGLHRVTNTDDKSFRAFRFEIKADICALPQFEALSEKICDVIKSKKSELDQLRKRMLKEELAKTKAIDAASRVLTWQHNAIKVNVVPTENAQLPQELKKQGLKL